MKKKHSDAKDKSLSLLIIAIYTAVVLAFSTLGYEVYETIRPLGVIYLIFAPLIMASPVLIMVVLFSLEKDNPPNFLLPFLLFVFAFGPMILGFLVGLLIDFLR